MSRCHRCGRLGAAHHAGVEVLVHAAERVRRHLSLAGQQQCDVGDAQRVQALRVRRPAVRQEDAVSCRGAAGTEAGRAAVRCGLDDVPALLQLLLPLIQDPVGHRMELQPEPPGGALVAAGR